MAFEKVQLAPATFYTTLPCLHAADLCSGGCRVSGRGREREIGGQGVGRLHWQWKWKHSNKMNSKWKWKWNGNRCVCLFVTLEKMRADRERERGVSILSLSHTLSLSVSFWGTIFGVSVPQTTFALDLICSRRVADSLLFFIASVSGPNESVLKG